MIPDWFIFSEYFPIGVLILLWPPSFTIFQSRIPKREDTERRQSVLHIFFHISNLFAKFR